MKYVNGFLTLILASAGLYFWIVLHSWWRVWRGERLTENFVKYMRYAFFTYVVVLVMFGGLRYLEDVQPASETISAKPKERKLSFVAKAVMTLKSEKAFLTECRLTNNKKFCDAINEQVSECIKTSDSKYVMYENVIADCQLKAIPK